MAIRVIKPQVSNQPVGIVQKDDTSAEAETYKALSETATAWGAFLFKKEAEKAQVEAMEYADNVKIPILDPKDGLIKKVPTPQGWGGIRKRTFEKAMQNHYRNSIDKQLRNVFSTLQLDKELALSPAKFQEAGSIRLKAIIDASDESFKGFVENQGTEYFGAALLNVKKNQTEQALKKLRFGERSNFGMKITQLEPLAKTDMPEAIQQAKAIIAEIQEADSILNPDDVRRLTNETRQMIYKSVMSSWMSGKNKDEIKYGLQEPWQSDKGNLPESIKSFIENNPEFYNAVEDDDDIRGHIQQTLNASESVPTSTTMSDFGGDKKPNRDENEEILKNILNKNTMTEEDFYSSPLFQKMIERNGGIPTSLWNSISQFVEDPTLNSEMGFDLYNLYRNATEKIMGNQISITNEGAFPSKFVSMINAIKPFMDINLSETKDMESTFNEAVKYYKAGEADKESFYNSFRGQLGFEDDANITEDKLVNALAKRLQQGGGLISKITGNELKGLNDEEAMLYAKEAMLYMRTENARGNPKDVESSIEVIKNTLKGDWGFDVGMYNSSGRPAFENENANYQRTKFTLAKMFPSTVYQGGEEKFREFVEQITGMHTSNAFLPKYGDNTFLLIDPRSKSGDARYYIMTRDERTGINEALSTPEGYPLAVSTRLFINHFYDGEHFTELEKQKKEEYLGEMDKPWSQKIADFFDSDEDITDENVDLLNIEATSQEEKEFEAMVLNKPDYIHKMCFKTDANQNMWEGKKSVDRKNPLNIVFQDNKFIGSVGKDPNSEFEVFETPADSYRAAMIILRTYQRDIFKGGMTVKDMVERWSGERDSDKWDGYKQVVTRAINGNENTKIDTTNLQMMYHILEAMTIQEIGWSTYCGYQGWEDWEDDIRNGILSASNL